MGCPSSEPTEEDLPRRKEKSACQMPLRCIATQGLRTDRRVPCQGQQGVCLLLGMIQQQEKQGMLYIQRESGRGPALEWTGGDPVGEWKGEAFERSVWWGRLGVGAGTRAHVAQPCCRRFAQTLRVTWIWRKGICSWFDFSFFFFPQFLQH